MSDLQTFIKSAAHVVPSERQLKWFDTEFYAFVHLSPNTFTGLEWGLGNESPDIFDPKRLDCDDWMEAIKSAGMRGAVITAKHHDGFCLWDTKMTKHSVMYSPYGRDIVRQFADACRRHGLKFGFYLSPWDRNSPLYGTDAYNDYYAAQLTELLCGYGEVFHIWFDSACGEGKTGKRQIYDFPRFFELIRKYQPNATIFHDKGPDVRWCGNETGTARHAEWAVVPGELCPYAEVQTMPSPVAGDLSGMENRDPDIGVMQNIIYSKGLAFAGAEIDMSIRKGWFWHEEEDPHPLEKLWQTYLTSVGANACLNLNVPPNRDGLIDERDRARLREFGELLERELGHNLARDVSPEITKTISPTQLVFEIPMKSASLVRYVELCEDISLGQRIESFKLELYDKDASELIEYMTYYGTTIGHKKICQIEKELWAAESARVKITVTSSRDTPHLKSVRVF